SHSRLRRYVANGRASGCPAETAVCNKGNRGAESVSGDGRRRIEHFPHARSAFRSFITDHDHIARIDLTALDRLSRFLITLEDPCRSFMHKHLVTYSGALYDASVRRQISFQDGKSAGLTVRMVDGTDDLRIQVFASFNILAHRFPCNCHAVQ